MDEWENTIRCEQQLDLPPMSGLAMLTNGTMHSHYTLEQLYQLFKERLLKELELPECNCGAATKGTYDQGSLYWHCPIHGDMRA